MASLIDLPIDLMQDGWANEAGIALAAVVDPALLENELQEERRSQSMHGGAKSFRLKLLESLDERMNG